MLPNDTNSSTVSHGIIQTSNIHTHVPISSKTINDHIHARVSKHETKVYSLHVVVLIVVRVNCDVGGLLGVLTAMMVVLANCDQLLLVTPGDGMNGDGWHHDHALLLVTASLHVHLRGGEGVGGLARVLVVGADAQITKDYGRREGKLSDRPDRATFREKWTHLEEHELWGFQEPWEP